MNLANESLADQALKEPLATLKIAQELLNSGQAIDEVETRRAIGVAHRLLGDLNRSESELLHAMSIAAPASKDWAASALSLGATFILQGRIDEALKLMTECTECATGITKAEAHFQLGTGFARAGQFDSTLVHYKRALPVIRRHGRKDWEAHLLANRGTVHQYLGNYQASLRDLDRAIDLNDELNSPTQRAYAQRNKAETLFLSGDLAGALQLYQIADDALIDLGVNEDQLTDKSDALMAAGLFDEVLSLCQAAYRFHHQAGNVYGQLDALAPASEAALALNDHATVAALVEATKRLPGAEAFPAWVARVQLASLRSKTLNQTVVPEDLDVALALTKDAASALGPVQAMKAGLAAANVAIALDQAEHAVKLIERLAKQRPRAPLHLQIEWWTLTARLRSQGHLARSPLRAIEAGLRLYQELVLSAGSFELRVLANRNAEELIAIGLDLLTVAGRTDRLVELVEQVRGGALIAHQPVAARSARALQTALRELAAAQAAIRRDRTPKKPVLMLQRRAAQLSRSAATIRATENVEVAILRHDESLITFVEHGDDLLAIMQTNSGSELRHCGSLATTRAAVDSQAFAARQLARSPNLSRRARRSLVAQMRDASQALSTYFFDCRLAPRVLINPTASLQPVSWGALPDLADRPHVICPALHVARRPLPRNKLTAFVAGATELNHVPTEIDGLARHYGVSALHDPTRSELAGLSGVDVMHLAGHFHLNGQNPLFSSVPFADAALHAHDILALAPAPAISVLSACSSGLGETVVGAPLGFASALLAAGGASVLVGQSTIEDGALISELMIDFHRELNTGTGPAEALFTIRRDLSTEAAVIAGSLVVVGTGW